MQLFLLIFVVMLLVYFFLYFKRIRKKKSQDNAGADETNEHVSEEVRTPKVSPSDHATRKTAMLKEDEWIVLKLVALKDRPYQGYEMIQTLLAEGLRFGKMNIFHRHEQDDENTPVLFSLASIAKPGTFDLTNIGTLECLGFTLFFSIKSVDDPLRVLAVMLETANNIAEELGGKLYTQTHQLLTDEQLQRLHCNVQLLQEKLHTPDLFTEKS